ncbi:alpha/beta hydrolase [Motilimonas sp. 1_MG-2023]|uniref:alpha/beta fold hydrolase n=1 Tax=Motilimonas sp. 1_MG-2023 TaxID=3062672 RepID=UPI0026E1B885|nr:alpha/beta hydrolase [Motilimonas sp. 1_MG-2023]MDO6525543.1 alpha/beta hydrolase [Motilimonas sp. 1_MG-2023]
MKFNATQSPHLPLQYNLKGNQASKITLVFLNGLFHGEASWIKQQRYQGFQNYKQLFLDYPGCGGNQLSSQQQDFTFSDIANAITELLQYLSLERVILVGYSLGGMLALEMAKQWPAQTAQPNLHTPHLEKIVLINSADRISIKGQWMMKNVQQLLNLDIPLPTLFSQVYPWFFSDEYLLKLDSMSDYVLQSYANYNQDSQGLTAFLHACHRRQNCDGNTRQSTPAQPNEQAVLSIPMLLITCSGDPLFPPSITTVFCQQSANITQIDLELQSHVANLEAAVAVNRHIEQFIPEHSPLEQTLIGATHAAIL